MHRAAAGRASQKLASSWRRLTRAATIVALLTAPALFVWFTQQNDWSWCTALLVTLGVVIVFRGFADLLFRRLIPWPSLFGIESQALREEDVVGRRRAWFWRFWFKIAVFFVVIITIVWLFNGGTWLATIGVIFDAIGNILARRRCGPRSSSCSSSSSRTSGSCSARCSLMNISQIQSFEPGDAEWGVKLDDVRGQARGEGRGPPRRRDLAVGRAVRARTAASASAACSSSARRAPGRRCSPRRSRPGSTRRSSRSRAPGFAATFIGIDAIIVRYLAWKAKRAARKWGGNCIVFIDEIDAVGMRRQALGTGFGGAINVPPLSPTASHEDPLLRPVGRAQPLRRPDPRDPRLAREAVRPPRDADRSARAASHRPMMRFYGFMFPGGMGGMGGHGAQPAARRHGRHRQPAVLPPRLHEPARTRCSTRASSSRAESAGSRCASRRRARARSRSTSSARRTSRSTASIRR